MISSATCCAKARPAAAAPGRMACSRSLAMSRASFQVVSRAASQSLSQAIWWGALLMLGEFGRRYAPLLADGLAPLVLWLLALATSAQFAGILFVTAHRVARTIALASILTVAALFLAWAGGGAEAILAAAASWGLLAVAVDRAARLLSGPPSGDPSRGPSGGSPGGLYRQQSADIPTAALGALMAWLASGQGVWGVACLIALCSACLAASCRGAAQTGLGADAVGDKRLVRFMRCMPAGWSCIASADSDGVLRCTRAVMLPMMGALVFSADWCVSSAVLDQTTATGIHLLAMFLLPCLLKACRIRLASAWLALPMGASLIGLLVLPGVQGLMAASITQSVAWGLSCVSYARPALPASDEAGLASWAKALLVIAIVAGLGGAAAGPKAFLLIHAALGIGAVLAALQSLIRVAGSASGRIELIAICRARRRMGDLR